MLTVSSNRGGSVYDTTYTYTLDGAVDTITYPSGRVVDYAHDFAGRPTGISVKAPGAGTFEPVASNIGYLPYGPAEHLEYGPAGALLTEDRDFDWHYRRTHQTVVDSLSTTRLDLDLGYDPAGNLTGITDTIGQRTASYGYDDLGRLISADWSTGAQTRAYDYDDIGNLERIGVNESLSGDGEVLFGYDLNPSTENSPVLSSVDTYEGVTLTASHTVVTDSAGNISDDGQAGYDYTLRNHLESRTLGVETSSYTFSADGRRLGMTRGATTLDVVLGLGGRRLSRVLNGATRDYVWLGDTLVGYFDGTATEPVRVLTSHIGFPLMAVDAAGTTVWAPMSEPYGELIGTFSKTADPGLRYPGQWQDEVDIEGTCNGDDCSMPGPLGGSVSLFENGFRWYRSAWGRYSQSDPIAQSALAQAGGRSLAIKQSAGGIALGQSLFSYANAAPTRYQDPIGLFAVDWDSCGDCNFQNRILRQAPGLSQEKVQNDIVEGMLLAYRMVGCLQRKDLRDRLQKSNWGDADGVKIRCLYGPGQEIGGKGIFSSCARGNSAGSVGKTIVLCDQTFANQNAFGFQDDVGDSIFHEWLHVSGGVPGKRDADDDAGAISRNAYHRLTTGACGTP